MGFNPACPYSIPMPKESGPELRAPNGVPPGNFVAKACTQKHMYVNSDDVIKCFLAYLCHKSRAPNFGPRTDCPQATL